MLLGPQSQGRAVANGALDHSHRRGREKTASAFQLRTGYSNPLIRYEVVRSPTIPDSPGHIGEFLDSIKSRKRTTCDVEYGNRLTTGGLLGNIAYRTGECLYWDDERERFTGHTQANRYVTRRYRKPWKLG